VAFVAVMVLFPFGYAFWPARLQDRAERRLHRPGNYQAMWPTRRCGTAEADLHPLRRRARIQLVLGVALGVLLHQVETLKGLVRTVMVSPFMLPPVVVGMMSIVVLDPGMGVANYLLKSVGLPPPTESQTKGL
jgi:multiple sugar transport system permease protein